MKAVLFDAAGVLTESFSADLVRPAIEAGADVDVLITRLYPIFAHAGDGSSIGNRLERGEVTLEQFFESLGADARDCRMVVDPESPTFFGNLWKPNVAMQAFVREVHDAGFATALVSNNVREWQPAWDRVVPDELPFGVRLFSWQVGMRKPEPGIYEAALAALGVSSGDAVFLDDFRAMVDGARAVGMTGIEVAEASQAIADAREILGL